MAVEPEQKRLKHEWEDLPYTMRFVWALGLLMVISAFSIHVRPVNPVENYIISEFGIQPTFVALSLFISGMMVVLVYRLTNNLSWVAACCLPGILWFLALGKQIAESQTAPAMHLVTAAAVIVFIALGFSFVRRIDQLEGEAQNLYEANKRLNQKLAEE